MDWESISSSGVGRKPNRSYRQFRPIVMSGFPHGLNTNAQPHQIEITECSELVNWRIIRGGQVETRRPITQYTDSVFTSNSPAKCAAYCSINGTFRELFVDDNNVLYYNNSGTPTQIGAAALLGPTTILPFSGVAVLLDGSYVKYVDGITSSSVKIAYDDGSGPSSYQYNNRTGADDALLAVGNGTITRAAAIFTTQSWDAGYTIPPTTVFANLTRIGNGYTGTDNVSVYIRLRRTSDDSIAAQKVLVAAPIATNLAAVATEYEVTFSSSDITSQMLPSTQYRLSIEYSNGDVSNHVQLNCTSVSSSGVASTYAAAAWSADTTKNPIVAIRPGRPPKGVSGTVHGGRLFVFGDTTQPGILFFSNITYLDWSTPDAAGYVGSVDSNANSYPIGAVVSIYGELYIFGTESQPYICKLTGSTPSTFSLPSVYQNSWAIQGALAVTPNDVWFATSTNLSNFSGVQEFGDMRTSPFADPVLDRFRSYWSSGSILEYNGGDGQVWLSFPSYHRILICHINLPSRIKGVLRYPWSEYEFTKYVFTDQSLFTFVASADGTNEYYLVDAATLGDPGIDTSPDAVILDGKRMLSGTIGSLDDQCWGYGDNDSLGFDTFYVRCDDGDPNTTGIELRSCIIPTMLKYVNGRMMVGSSDGYVYVLNPSSYKELDSIQIRYDLRTAYVTPHIDAVVVERIEYQLGGRLGGQFSIYMYADNSFKSPGVDAIQHSMQLDDRLTVSDMTMDVEDAYFLVDSGFGLLQEWVNMVCYSLQFRITNVLLSGDTVAFNKIETYIRPLEI